MCVLNKQRAAIYVIYFFFSEYIYTYIYTYTYIYAYIFCDDCSGDDSIEHYACCQCTRDLLADGYGCHPAWNFRHFSRSMSWPPMRIRTALLVYAVYSVVNSLRSKQLRTKRGAANDVLRERLRHACMMHYGCDSVLAQARCLSPWLSQRALR